MDMQKYKFLVLFVFLFSSCSSMQTAQEYDRASRDGPVVVEFEGKAFNVFDDTEKSAALLMEGLGTGMGKAFIEGLTFTILDLTAAVSKFEGAMNIFLNENKDGNCEITRSNRISDNLGGSMGYEIFYKCQQSSLK